MRFDDTLETVLSADLTTPIGVQSAWRQLVDLIGRRRVPADMRAMARLRAIRDQVPLGVRAASARALEYANPPSLLVRLFALDDLRVAMPVMRTARMTSSEWIELLPDLAPSTRAILRNRRDLGPTVKRALESFGPIDFVLPDQSASALVEHDAPDEQAPDAPTATDWPVAEAAEPELVPPQPTIEPPVLAEPVADVEAAPAPAPVAEDEVLPAPMPAPMPFAEPDPDYAEPTIRTGELLAKLEALTAAPLETLPEAEPTAVEVEAFAIAATEPAEPVLAAEPEASTADPQPTADDAAPAIVEPIDAAPEASTPPADEPEAAPDEQEPPSPAAEVEQATPSVFATLGAASWYGLGAPTLAIVPELVAEQPATVTEQSAEPSPEPDLSFVALAEGSLGAAVQSGTAPADAPIAAEAAPAQNVAMDQADAILDEASPPAADLRPAHDALPADEGTFEIADVVARIDAFWRNREEAAPARPAPALAEAFRFETDATGIVRWVEGVSRAPVIGLSLDLQGNGDGPRVDGVAAGAFRRRASFANARMVIEGDSDAAGDWRISAVPVFDPANGRFTGYRGTGRRPRADERAEPQPAIVTTTPADSLRQLVHELRTPTNAIAGFAEMIETQMLGPVADPYRHRAGDIRMQARELLGAIDDLDLAARIDSAALALVPGRVALRPLLAGIADDLAALADLRGASIALPIDDLAVNGDRRAVERLLTRLMATLVSASGEGERISVRLALDADDLVTIAIDRPAALADYPGESVLGIDDEHEDATLLGTGFALRLARNLARELGGSMVIEPESLTLRLPAAVTANVDQAHLS